MVGTTSLLKTTIRAAEERDAAAIAGIYAPYVRETAISFETETRNDAQICNDFHTLIVNRQPGAGPDASCFQPEL